MKTEDAAVYPFLLFAEEKKTKNDSKLGGKNVKERKNIGKQQPNNVHIANEHVGVKYRKIDEKK